jgi:hypothetical protein
MRHPHAKRPAKPKFAPVVPDRPPPMEPLAVRPAQAAHLLSMSQRTIWTHIAKRRLTVSRVGGITLVHMASIRALLDRSAGDGAP